MKKTAGIHHITAIVGHPQENVDFYAGILGLRLIKKTVNFDDPGTYHLYFGDDGGKPGTIITFFPWAGAAQGKIGGGQVGVTTYAIPVGSLVYWETRLSKFAIRYEKTSRFGETYLQFEDYHGLQLELVERADGQLNHWTFGEVTPDVAIKGFGGAILYSTDPNSTIETLQETMGLEKIAEEDDLIRLRAYGEIGNIIDVKQSALAQGIMGVGTVHHIAWRAKDEADHVDWQDYVYNKGYGVTEIKDRNYFNAIYFREYGDILFEIATDTPGFAHDESYETMGQSLKLPTQYESAREKLITNLIPIEVRELD
ncbi:ring-cleaving dioxygenase [Carnobacterium viridans]|uniref:Glyoxalase family protein n=1 Tax=Carnobacterium viridans TaxID=174587 RepID=A0A1H0ZJR0_9LACT|nr:ring-cleaving dioxygenase [Carnobacterium viridans]UDE94608.1 ring-cleaving dioxygenase [Carnobacterium viridans]SDQ27346.1 glyoxalase family protein [Carnobacterium viridans]